MSGVGQGGVANVRMEDLLKYLQNPYQHLKQIRNASIYLTNKHGILKDVLRMIKTLPTLKYSLNWGVESEKDISRYEKEINQFLRDIDVVEFIRDGLYETALLGTVIPVLRSRKYIQFLEIDEVSITKMRNGKWVVDYDLSHIDGLKTAEEKINKINSLPDEITLAKYNNYKNKKDDKNRFVELKNCEVVTLDNRRNSPFGLPYTIGAWYTLLQKEMINQVEESMSQRLLTQIIMLKAGHFDKEGKRPVTDDVVAPYFKGVSEVLKTKDSTARRGSGNINGSGLIQVPYFIDLESLKIDTTMFDKDLYDKLENDIHAALGVSKALIYGEGGNYSSAQVNSEKLFSIIFSMVEQLGGVVNSFIKTLLPSDVTCEIKFDKTTVLDKQTEIKNKYDLYMQTSLLTPWIEAVVDMPIQEIVKQKEYEKELKLDTLFQPAQSAHTMRGDVGRPENTEGDNDNTNKSKTNNGNNIPSPSD